MMGKRELVALVDLSCWCLVIVVWLFFLVQRIFLQLVIVVLWYFLIILTIFHGKIRLKSASNRIGGFLFHNKACSYLAQ